MSKDWNEVQACVRTTAQTGRRLAHSASRDQALCAIFVIASKPSVRLQAGTCALLALRHVSIIRDTQGAFRIAASRADCILRGNGSHCARQPHPFRITFETKTALHAAGPSSLPRQAAVRYPQSRKPQRQDSSSGFCSLIRHHCQSNAPLHCG